VETQVDQFTIGAVELTRISESCVPAAFLTHLPALPADAIERHSHWLVPAFYEPTSAKLVFSIHSWLIRTPKTTMLFELGAGNGKHRPNFPRAHMLDTPWLETLAAAGVRPEDVDVVAASHLHTDHVGWFTRKVGSAWVPTFPNARYIVPEREYDNWDPAVRERPVPAFNEGVIEDCVLPVAAAGQIKLTSDDFVIDEYLRLLPAPGHTLGHCVLEIRSGREGAIVAGDIAYSPLQIVYPELNAYADEDAAAGPVTRRRYFDICADNKWLFMPEHFGPPYTAVRLARAGDSYDIYDLNDRLIGSRD
jgi:glyoxylase-like metal-dependent hydrolase (beta-lactamase superfamily II)